METIFYNLQNIIIDLKKLNNTFDSPTTKHELDPMPLRAGKSPS